MRRKTLTEPTLLEMSGYQELAGCSCSIRDEEFALNLYISIRSLENSTPAATLRIAPAKNLSRNSTLG